MSNMLKREVGLSRPSCVAFVEFFWLVGMVLGVELVLLLLFRGFFFFFSSGLRAAGGGGEGTFLSYSLKKKFDF